MICRILITQRSEDKYSLKMPAFINSNKYGPAPQKVRDFESLLERLIANVDLYGRRSCYQEKRDLMRLFEEETVQSEKYNLQVSTRITDKEINQQYMRDKVIEKLMTKINEQENHIGILKDQARILKHKQTLRYFRDDRLFQEKSEQLRVCEHNAGQTIQELKRQKLQKCRQVEQLQLVLAETRSRMKSIELATKELLRQIQLKNYEIKEDKDRIKRMQQQDCCQRCTQKCSCYEKSCTYSRSSGGGRRLLDCFTGHDAKD